MSFEFAIALKKARIKSRQTQESFSKACGVNKSTLKAWETGRAVPSFEKFDLIIKGVEKMNINTVELETNYLKAKMGSVKNNTI